MMKRHYALRDDQWKRIRDFLIGREGHVGGTAKDNRLFVEAALYRYRAGIAWRDLPERFGDFRVIHTRHTRWCKRGGQKKECIGRSKGGLTTKIHVLYDALGNPTGFCLTPGQAHDLEEADVLLPNILTTIQAFLADKAYDAQERVLDLLQKVGVKTVIPPKSNRKKQR